MIVQLVVISPGPLMVVEVPADEKGELLIRWRDLLKAMTPVMRGHGFKQKDMSSIERIEPGKPMTLTDFWIYRYDLAEGAFVVVKEPGVSALDPVTGDVTPQGR